MFLNRIYNLKGSRNFCCLLIKQKNDIFKQIILLNILFHYDNISIEFLVEENNYEKKIFGIIADNGCDFFKP